MLDIKQPFWSLDPSDVIRHLRSHATRGLSDSDVRERVRAFGANSFARAKGPSTMRIVARQFQSPLILILVGAAGVTTMLGEWHDAIVIGLAVIVNTFVGFYQEYKAERALADLSSYIRERTRVVRNGAEQEIDSSALVPGDIIHLSHGMRVPADARIIVSQHLAIDESILTGESLPVAKHVDRISEAAMITAQANMVFGGTLVAEGAAQCIVTATGKETEIGKLAALVGGTRQERTPLQRAVSLLAWVITAGISLLVFWIFILGTSRGEPVVDMFVVSIAVAVGAIPEALPVGLTAVLAVGIQRIAKRKGIMRNLVAAETLGSTSVIIVDKTGTLTEAKMQLMEVADAHELAHGSVSERLTGATHKELLRLAATNTDVLIENPGDAPELWRVNGRTLEANIVQTAGVHGVYAGIADAASRIIIPFSSVHKFSLAFDPVSSHYVVVGAPDVLLARADMNKDDYLTTNRCIEGLSERGRRVLGIAVLRKEDVPDEHAIRAESLRGLVFKGAIAFHDPIRADIPSALQRIAQFGIHVVMATGDLKGTALAIAKDIGWSVGPTDVMTGEEMRSLDDATLIGALQHVRVFARMLPEDKLRIARLYQSRGDIVAMTGDGVNDAPTLKAANIGIAVGSGSDVAKSVADLVLLDDSFSTIGAAVEEGRRMLVNIRKIFVYLMSNSLDVVVIISGSLLAGLAIPLSAMQIIWVNLFTGSLPAVALAFDTNNDPAHAQKNVGVIIDREVSFLTIGVGVFTSLLLFFMYWTLTLFVHDAHLVRSVLFACVASYILIIAFSIHHLRKPLFSYPLFENRFLVAAVALGFFLLSLTLYLPPLQAFFGTTGLPPLWVAFVCGWMVVNVALIEFAKRLFYRDASL